MHQPIEGDPQIRSRMSDECCAQFQPDYWDGMLGPSRSGLADVTVSALPATSSPAKNSAPLAVRRSKSGDPVFNLFSYIRGLRVRAATFDAPTTSQMWVVFKRSFAEIKWHFSHPRELNARCKILVASFREDARLRSKIEKRENLLTSQLVAHLQGGMGRAYLYGLTLGCTLGSILGMIFQSKLNSPSAGIAAGIMCDYLVQLGVFSGVFIHKHRNYFFDRSAPQEAAARRLQFVKLLTSDFFVSAAIYTATGLCSRLVAMVPVLAPATPAISLATSCALYVVLALGNVMAKASFMVKPYAAFLKVRGVSVGDLSPPSPHSAEVSKAAVSPPPQAGRVQDGSHTNDSSATDVRPFA